MTRALQRESFRAMGTICDVAVTAGSDDVFPARSALDAAQAEVAACERVLSRFDPHSDLSRLNRAAGEWVAVDARLIEALAAALRGRKNTHGLFDPTILPALVAVGYDRSFELLTERAAAPLDGWHGGARIDIDPGAGQARVEQNAAVDLGGIGKGFAATRALHAMRTAWPALPGALVDLGGDIAVWGDPPEGGPWRVDIADPRAHEQVVWDVGAHGAEVSPRRDAIRAGSAPAGGSTTSSTPRRASPPLPARSRSPSWQRAPRRPSRTQPRSESPLSTVRATCSPHAPMSRRCSSLRLASPSRSALSRSPLLVRDNDWSSTRR